MQRPDEKKRALITTTAARLFATRPYHKVRLEDIAAEARIGKGTLYIYFDNKEDLYFSLIADGFARLVDRLRDQLGHAPAAASGRHEPNGRAEHDNGNGHAAGDAAPPPSPLPATKALERIVGELVAFAFSHPHFSELMRTVGVVKGPSKPEFERRRVELRSLIEETIRRGVAAGELDDPHPELTALYVPGMVRAAMLFGPKGTDEATVRDQILRVLERGIVRSEARSEPG